MLLQFGGSIRRILPAIDFGEAAEVADDQRPRITKDRGSSIASYGVSTAAEISEVRSGDPLDVDTVSRVVGNRSAVQMEVGTLFREDASPVIAADGSLTGQLHRRVSSAGDTAAGN